MSEIPTREQLKKLKVVNLRQRLAEFSLPQGGKSILIIMADTVYHVRHIHHAYYT